MERDNDNSFIEGVFKMDSIEILGGYIRLGILLGQLKPVCEISGYYADGVMGIRCRHEDLPVIEKLFTNWKLQYRVVPAAY